MQIRKLLDPRSGMEIRDKHPGSAALVTGTVSIFTDRMVSTVSTGHCLEKCSWSLCQHHFERF
jgi:hypothetical protein